MISLKNAQQQLKQTVIGQDQGVNQLTQAVYKYLIRLHARDCISGFTGSTTVLIQGDSGTGKTYLVKETAKLFNIPMIEINSKSICQEGWHGKSFVELIAEAIREHSTMNHTSLVGGIIFIDEIDKILTPNPSSHHGDVNLIMQQSLLKYIEGFKASHRELSINLNNWMFVFAGAFVGISNHQKENQEIGFTRKAQKQTRFKLRMQDLIDFGMIPEFAGRIQNLIQLNQIRNRVYLNILESRIGHYQAYKTMFQRMYLDFNLNKQRAIRHAIQTNLGVRGLIQGVEIQVSEFMEKNVSKIDLELYSPLTPAPVR